MIGKKNAASQIKQKLEANGYRCALTGWSLTPETFELDHIVSLSDGGRHEVGNLQCVHPLVNKAKGTMSNSQFIDMCKAVAEQAKMRELGMTSTPQMGGSSGT